MPQDDLVERVAEAIYAAANPSAPAWDSLACLSLWGVEIDQSYAAARAAIEAIQAEPEAEPLTTTPEHSTTETEREAPINQDPPEGFEYEYRAVIDTRAGKSYDDWTLSRRRAEEDAKWAANWVIERRLVGPPERVQGDE